jgi:hypothetical protein
MSPGFAFIQIALVAHDATAYRHSAPMPDPFHRQARLVVEVDLLSSALQASGRPAGIGHISGVV